MKKFYLFLGFMILSLTSHQVFAQNWPRTFSGEKDATSDSFLDGGDVYVVGSNGTYLPGNVTSAEDSGFTAIKGGYVAKFNLNGSTQWYTTLNNLPSAWGLKIMVLNNYVYALNEHKIYILDKNNGAIIYTYQLGLYDNYNDDKIEDFEIVESTNGTIYMFVLSEETLANKLHIKVVDVFNNFNFMNGETFTTNNPGYVSIYNGKLKVLGNQIFLGVHYRRNNSVPSTVSYPLAPTMNIGSAKYFIFNLGFALSGSFPINYLNEVTLANPGVPMRLYDYDLSKDPTNPSDFVIFAADSQDPDRIFTFKAPTLTQNAQYQSNLNNYKTSFTVLDSKIYFYDESLSVKTIYEMEFNGTTYAQTWNLQTICFYPLSFGNSVNLKFVTGWYDNQCTLSTLPNNFLPPYTRRVKSAIVVIAENNNVGYYLKPESNQQPKEFSFQISPNPAIDFINLGFNEGGVKNISIVNDRKQLVYQLNKKITAKSLQIDLSKQNPGIYYVQVEFENGQFVNQTLMLK